MAGLFAEPDIRRRVLLALVMSFATTIAFWGIGAWIPPYMAAVGAKAGLNGQEWVSFGGMAVNGTTVMGYVGFRFLADAYGRKPVTLFYVAAAFLSVPLLFYWAPTPAIMLLCGGGVSQAAMGIAMVYLASLVAAMFLPETLGKPLPG